MKSVVSGELPLHSVHVKPETTQHTVFCTWNSTTLVYLCYFLSFALCRNMQDWKELAGVGACMHFISHLPEIMSLRGIFHVISFEVS